MKGLSLKEKVEIFNQIEKEFPVEQLSCMGIQVWPLIRTRMAYPMRAVPKNPVILLGWLGYMFFLSIRSFLQSRWFKLVDRSGDDQNKQAEVVLPRKTDGRREKIDEKYFNSFGDSLATFASDQVSFKILEYFNIEKFRIPRWGTSTLIAHHLYWESFLMTWKWIFAGKRKTPVQAWDAFEQFCQEREIPLNFEASLISYHTQWLLAYSRFFTSFFQKNGTKAVIFKFFPELIAMSACLASHRLGIRSVDIQHGQQGDFHPMNTHWTNFPASGYQLIPSHFWMWGQLSANRILDWTQKSDQHHVFIGGNPWFRFYLDRQKTLPSPAQKDKRTKVLIAMQWVTDFKESCIIEAMQQSQDDIFWHVRMHPRLIDKLDEVKQFLDAKGIQNYETEFANSSAIYDIFSAADILVTFWSTVAYEALAFDLHAVIVHPNGKDAMQDYIQQGIFAYADSADLLLSTIRAPHFSPEKEPYIVTDRETLQASLLALAE